MPLSPKGELDFIVYNLIPTPQILIVFLIVLLLPVPPLGGGGVNKKPGTCAGFKLFIYNSNEARHLTMHHHQPLLFVLIILISIANMGEKFYLGKFFCWRTLKKNIK
jgi:hypothetical protein